MIKIPFKDIKEKDFDDGVYIHHFGFYHLVYFCDNKIDKAKVFPIQYYPLIDEV